MITFADSISAPKCTALPLAQPTVFQSTSVSLPLGLQLPGLIKDAFGGSENREVFLGG